jgi:hypothetical protein
VEEFAGLVSVAPGNSVFSFRDTTITALRIARSYCYESPEPTELGSEVTIGSSQTECVPRR